MATVLVTGGSSGIGIGQDGAAMEQMVRESSTEKLAALLRDYVAGLMA